MNSNASTFVTLSLVHPAFGQAFEYEVQIVPNQPGGLYSVYGLTADSVIITAQRIVNSELTQFLIKIDWCLHGIQSIFVRIIQRKKGFTQK